MKELLNPENWTSAYMGRNVNLDKLLVTGRLTQDESIILNLEIIFEIGLDLSFNLKSYSIKANNCVSSYTFYDFTKNDVISLYSALAKSCNRDKIQKENDIKDKFEQDLRNLLIVNEVNTE